MRFADYLKKKDEPIKEPSFEKHLPFLKELQEDSRAQDGKDYFDPSAVERAYTQNAMSRETVIHLSPEQFLNLATKLKEARPEKEEKIDAALKSGTKLSDVPYLTAVTDEDGNLLVDGHEGRHRMMALHRLGVREVPVVLISGEGGDGQCYRWGNTDKRPRTITGQDDRLTLPMPKIQTF